MNPELRERIISYNKVKLRNQHIVDAAKSQGIVLETQKEQSDKLGFDWVNYYVNNILAYTEYVPQENPVGTSDNPIAWTAITTLIPNAYYVHEDMRKVWMGESGVTASWDDEKFVIF